ncbi:MAG: hypothetical protein VKK63_11915, partial [Synechococcus sp.]|nr:hypothetical protein [Synechococcus sp.]
TPTYRWSVVSGATWYQLRVTDSIGALVNRWYTAAEVNASSGECSVTPPEAIALGSATWWVRAWNAQFGNGPWSAGSPFSLCSVGFDSAWTQASAAGGVYLVDVVSSGEACEWSVANQSTLPDWVTIISGSGSGSSLLTIDVAANLFEARQAVLEIGDQQHLISQVGPGAFVGWHFESASVEVSGVQYRVLDVFAQFDDSDATVVNVFDSLIRNVELTAFHHNDLRTFQGLSGDWRVGTYLPSEGVTPDDDTFVLIGGPYSNLNSTILDPSFGSGTQAVPPPQAGWFNVNPLNQQGRVDPFFTRTHVARLVIEDGAAESLSWSANVGYNLGVGTPAQFGFEPTNLNPPSFLVPY